MALTDELAAFLVVSVHLGVFSEFAGRAEIAIVTLTVMAQVGAMVRMKMKQDVEVVRELTKIEEEEVEGKKKKTGVEESKAAVVLMRKMLMVTGATLVGALISATKAVAVTWATLDPSPLRGELHHDCCLQTMGRRER